MKAFYTTLFALVLLLACVSAAPTIDAPTLEEESVVKKETDPALLEDEADEMDEMDTSLRSGYYRYGYGKRKYGYGYGYPYKYGRGRGYGYGRKRYGGYGYKGYGGYGKKKHYKYWY